jgi:uncharacterized membrane protein YkvA (DUF1232 family)
MMADADSILLKAERATSEVMGEAERLVDQVAPPAERHMVKQALDLSAGSKLRLVWRLWRDPRVRDVTRIPMIAGLVYMLLPIHFLPRRLGPLRSMEKLIVLVALLWLLVRVTPRNVLREHLDAVA